jgi:creatinine amidohydrolase
VDLAVVTSPGLPPSPTVLVPVGSIEQHGPHLPLDTDTAIAVAVAQGAARALERNGITTVVAPALWYGSSGEHQDFPGTSSIGNTVLRDVLIELARSMGTWARSLVFVNAHGGNVPVLHHAVNQLAREGHDVTWVACAIEEIDLHAGRTETSLMLHLRPSDVRLDRAEPGNTGALEELLPAMLAGGVKAVSPNGVLGDPAGATPAEGALLLDRMVADVVARVLSSIGTS